MALRPLSASRVSEEHRDFELPISPARRTPRLFHERQDEWGDHVHHGSVWLGFAAECHAVTSVAISGRSPRSQPPSFLFFLLQSVLIFSGIRRRKIHRKEKETQIERVRELMMRDPDYVIVCDRMQTPPAPTVTLPPAWPSCPIPSYPFFLASDVLLLLQPRVVSP